MNEGKHDCSFRNHRKKSQNTHWTISPGKFSVDRSLLGELHTPLEKFEHVIKNPANQSPRHLKSPKIILAPFYIPTSVEGDGNGRVVNISQFQSQGCSETDATKWRMWIIFHHKTARISTVAGTGYLKRNLYHCLVPRHQVHQKRKGVFTRSYIIRIGVVSDALKIHVVIDVFYTRTDPIKLTFRPLILVCTVAWFARNRPDTQ
jgi:hypothetical protein